MEEERGKLLYTGVTRRWGDTIRGQKIAYIKVIIVLFINVGAICMFGSFRMWLPTGILLIPLSVVLLMIYYLGGFEIDGIYERGITNGKTTLLERIIGKGFHPYKNITKIGYGVHDFPKGKTEFIVGYEYHSKKPTIASYIKINYKNDFYERLIETLKCNCPNVEWEQIEWRSLPFSKG